MIVRKAWLPSFGIQQIETTNEVYNSTIGQALFSPVQPRDMDVVDKSPLQEHMSPHYEVTGKPFLQDHLNIASLADLATVEQEKDDSAQYGRWTARDAPKEISIELFASRFDKN